MIGTQAQQMTCRACGKVWPENTLTNVAIELWIQHINSITCPECGAGTDKISMKTL